MRKIMIDGKEHWQQEECDIPKIPMTYPADLLKNNQPERSKREDAKFVYRKPDGTEEPVRFMEFKDSDAVL